MYRFKSLQIQSNPVSKVDSSNDIVYDLNLVQIWLGVQIQVGTITALHLTPPKWYTKKYSNK